MQGWVKIYRQIQESAIWTDEEPFDRRSAFIDLILMANHADKKMIFNGQPIEVKAGQRITSIRSLAERWHWSTNRVLRFLDLLENLEMIERKSDKQKTLLTIVNYSKFQVCQNTNGDTDGDSNGDSNGDKTRKKEQRTKKNGSALGKNTHNYDFEKLKKFIKEN